VTVYSVCHLRRSIDRSIVYIVRLNSRQTLDYSIAHTFSMVKINVFFARRIYPPSPTFKMMAPPLKVVH